MPQTMSARAFAAAAREASPPGDAVIRQGFLAEVAATGGREFAFTLSTADIDRANDVVMQDGWRLDAYRRNPVVLWAHDNVLPPIGRATAIAVEDGRLRATAEFAKREENRMADEIFRLLKAGYLNAVSVGFQPIKWQWAEDEDRAGGIDFVEQELVEFSVVSVPANPHALVETRGLSRSGDSALGEWARNVLGVRPDDVIVSRARLDSLEAAHAELVAVKAAEMASPPPRRLPRLTEASLRLASLGRR